MDIGNPQLTPEIREALAANPNEPLYIADAETQKVYVILETGRFPQLEEDYVRDGLDLARGQIARGEISAASIQELVAEAKRRDANQI
jgi:hypothetical protein